MKVVTILSLLLLASPVFGELTKEDLQDLRTIVKEENAASEKRTREYIDLKIDGVEKSLNAKIEALDKRIDDIWRLMIGIFGLIAAAIALPQIIIAYKEKGQKEMEKGQKEMQTQIDQLRERLEAMNQ